MALMSKCSKKRGKIWFSGAIEIRFGWNSRVVILALQLTELCGYFSATIM